MVGCEQLVKFINPTGQHNSLFFYLFRLSSNEGGCEGPKAFDVYKAEERFPSNRGEHQATNCPRAIPALRGQLTIIEINYTLLRTSASSPWVPM